MEEMNPVASVKEHFSHSNGLNTTTTLSPNLRFSFSPLHKLRRRILLSTENITSSAATWNSYFLPANRNSIFYHITLNVPTGGEWFWRQWKVNVGRIFY